MFFRFFRCSSGVFTNAQKLVHNPALPFLNAPLIAVPSIQAHHSLTPIHQKFLQKITVLFTSISTSTAHHHAHILRSTTTNITAAFFHKNKNSFFYSPSPINRTFPESYSYALQVLNRLYVTLQDFPSTSPPRVTQHQSQAYTNGLFYLPHTHTRTPPHPQEISPENYDTVRSSTSTSSYRTFVAITRTPEDSPGRHHRQ